MLKNSLFALVDETNYKVLVGVLDVKDDSLIPDWLHANAYICLCLLLVLEDLNLMLGIF